MSKLGKKARKFAKKDLQSVLKRRRKTKALFKRKSSKGGKNYIQEQVETPKVISSGRSTKSEGSEITSLDLVLTENDKNEVADASDSDGYISEDSSCPYFVECEIGNGKALQDEIAISTYSAQNKKIQVDLAIKKKKLDKIIKKDPEFCKFLKSHDNRAKIVRDEDADYSDEGDTSEQGDNDLAGVKSKLLTNHVIKVWCKMIKEEHSESALISLLNAYRSACHYGAESIGNRIEDTETFCNILLFMLSNADDIFRGLLQISSLNCPKETLQKLKDSTNWKKLKPLVKSYVRSTLFLLNQVTDTEILGLAMMRVRASLLLFVSFPSLIQRLIKVTVHLWATGGMVLSSASFHIIRDVTTMFTANYFDNCLSKTVVAFISVSRVTEIADIKHMQFLRDCIVELCSLDMQKSSVKAVTSLSQLTKILNLRAQTKTKESVKRVCSWEFVNCIDLWVKFLSTYCRDYDLQPLLFTTIQLINGLAYMFPAQRYFPLRLKCIKWLNYLSSSTGTFIPLSSLVLDMLEYKVVKEGRKAQNAFNFASVLKLPKHYLKLKNFHEECVQAAIEQLSLHFSHWSYHISFPDLATIPLIHLRKFHETTATESLRRVVKRMIEQVEQNVEFVQKKRDDVPFSPHDHQSMESFLQLEKFSLKPRFTQYYRSVLENAAQRSLRKFGNMSLPQQKQLKKNGAVIKSKRDATTQMLENGDSMDTKSNRRAVTVL